MAEICYKGNMDIIDINILNRNCIIAISKSTSCNAYFLLLNLSKNKNKY